MNKKQRKKLARDKKRNAKAARKARKGTDCPRGSEPAQAVSGAGGARTPLDAVGAPAPRAASTEKPWHLMTNEELRADPELLEAVLASRHRDEESFALEDTAHEAERELDWARGKVKEAKAMDNGDPSTSSGQAAPRRRITDERALEMLEDAAEATHDVLLMVREALRGVSPERRAAARAILNEKPQKGTDGRKLPRRAPDPVVTLEKLNLQAASLLKRILAITNPGAGKKKAA
jgi:hypothetical protein